MKSKRTRKSERVPMTGKARIVWTTNGSPCASPAKLLNISEFGAALEVAEPIAPLTFVQLELEPVKIRCVASVRHCRKTSVRYAVGVEFGEGVRWQVSGDAG